MAGSTSGGKHRTAASGGPPHLDGRFGLVENSGPLFGKWAEKAGRVLAYAGVLMRPQKINLDWREVSRTHLAGVERPHDSGGATRAAKDRSDRLFSNRRLHQLQPGK